MNILHLLGKRPARPVIDEALLSSLLTLAWVVEARDPYTGGQLWRVAQYCALLAEKSGFAPAEVARLALGGFVHDLGKVGIPDAILRKPGPLNDDEYAVIRTHPEIGRRMLETHPIAALVMDAVASHHETPDGSGYPHGLGAADISTMAAITGICDAFDAMTSSRAYRPGMPLDRALGIIGQNLGTQFNTHYGRLFIELGHEGLLDAVMGHTDAGIPLRRCAMCGPTVVLQQAHVEGDHVFCPSCASGYELVRPTPDAALALRATGQTGSADDLAPQPDTDLLARLARQFSPARGPA